MKVTYIALDPLRYPRIKKIAHTLRKYSNIDFHVMIPKIRLISRGGKIKRVIYAIVNYASIILQIFFVKSDIFWVANCPDILVIPLILRRKQYILEYRSPWSLDVENEFGRGLLVRLASFVEYFALKHARIVTLTTSRLFIKVKGFRKPIFIIPNYPLKNFGTVTVPRAEFRSRYGCREGDSIVLFVGKLTRTEGADLLPKIMEDVLKSRNDAVFWIVGDGPLYPLLEEFAKRFHGKIKLFGWQPYKFVPNFINAADVCIKMRRSKYSEYYNEEGVQKLSEYMFFEKPIVACGVAESSEYLLVDEDKMADGILKALRGEAPRSNRRTWEEYSEEKIYEMLELIKSLI